MNINNLKVELDIREDKKGAIYHIGRLRAPINIDLSNGATFLIFISASGEEELQIACNDKDNATFPRYTKKADRIKVGFEDREDQHCQNFFVSKLQYNGYVNCSGEKGAVFMVFTSKEGSEELQIVGDIIPNKSGRIVDHTGEDGIEILYK